MRQLSLTITLALSLLACAPSAPSPSSPSAPAPAPAAPAVEATPDIAPDAAPDVAVTPDDAPNTDADDVNDTGDADDAEAAPGPADEARAYWEGVARRCADCREEGPPPTLAQVVAVETQVFAQDMDMGTEVQIRCLPMDAQGAPMEGLELPAQVQYSPASAMERADEGAWRAMAPGVVQVTCAAPSLGLRDATPARLEIKPGEPHRVLTALSRPQVSAGERVHVQCSATDAFGYAVNAEEAVIKVSPTGEGVEIEGRTLTIRQAGDFLVSCALEGAQEVFSEPLSVTPGALATLALEPRNAQAAYRVGDRLDLDFVGADHWENPVPALGVRLQAHEGARQEGCCAVVFTRPGRHSLTFVSATPGVRAALDVLVDDGAPSVTCGLIEGSSPLEIPAGTTRRFEGVATDTSGVREVTVQGRRATLIPVGDGQKARWQAELTVGAGALLAPIEVTDNLGNKTARLCSRWSSPQPPLAPDAPLARAAQIHLSAPLLDDRDREGAPDSFGDLLQRALQSPTTLDAIRAQVLQRRQLTPGKCRDESWGVCWFSFGLNQTDFRPGAVQVQLAPDEGGFRVDIRMDGLRSELEAYGRAAQVYTYKIRGRFAMDLAVTGRLRLSYEGDAPRLSLRDVEARLGDIDSELDGDDPLVELVAEHLEAQLDSFEWLISAIAAPKVADALQRGANELFAGLTLPIPSSVDTAPGVMTRLSDARLRAEGLTLTLESSVAARIPRFSAPAATVAPDPGARVVVQEAALNQQLAALWRGGQLEEALQGAVGQLQLSGAPRGLRFDLTLHHAPAVELTRGANDRVEARLHVLAATLTLRDPVSLGASGEVPRGATFSVGAQLGLRLELDDEGQLRLREATMQRLALVPDAPLPALRLDSGALAALLTPLLRAGLAEALERHPVTLPFPAWEATAMARRLGLPAGALVVTPTALSLEPGQIVIDVDLTHRSPRP